MIEIFKMMSQNKAWKYNKKVWRSFDEEMLDVSVIRDVASLNNPILSPLVLHSCNFRGHRQSRIATSI